MLIFVACSILLLKESKLAIAELIFSFNREKEISGDLFISVDRAKENSEINNETYLNETSRLVIHGLLHLCGYNDKTDAQSKTMRSKENQYLKMIGFT